MTRFYEDGKGTTYTQIMRDVWEVKGLKGNYTVDVENSALLTGEEIIEYCDDPINMREAIQTPMTASEVLARERSIYASAEAHAAMGIEMAMRNVLHDPAPNDINLERVKQFHTVFGHPVNDRPTIGNPELNELRLKLIREETQELWDALNAWDADWLNLAVRKIQTAEGLTATQKVDRMQELLDMHDNPDKHVADALADLQYVLDGAWLAFGFHRVKEECMAEVHRSNMSKLGSDGLPVKREDGKILKGPNYSLPDLGPIVAKLF